MAVDMVGLFASIIAFSDAASILFKGDPFDVESCNIGGTIENECNTCVCTQNHVYECSSKNSSVCNYNEEKKNDSLCNPSAIYVMNDTLCICNKTGQWPHKKCTKLFRSLGTEPQIICEPNSYVPYDCNVCRCPPDGKLDRNRCTKNKCEITKENQYKKSRRFAQKNNVYGNCEVKNWYSLAPCQFCFCVNENKLVCNTGNNYAHKLELGAYNLSVCGKELIREAIELIPENQKSLRYGYENKTNSIIDTETAKDTPQHEETESIKYITQPENDVAIDVNREKGSTQNNINNNNEYYTDSEEGTKPYDDKIQNSSDDDKKGSELEPDSDNDMGVEIEADTVKPHEHVIKETELRIPNSFQPHVEKLPDNFNLGEALKLNLPMVLDKVFQMALRKSMVSMDSESGCTPGSATILKCNVCFCVKENKLLCTNNVCR